MDSHVQSALDENQSDLESSPSKGLNDETNAYLTQIKGFEEDRVEIAKNSAKTAWKVAAGFGVVSILSVGAVIGLTPLKEVHPFIVRVDNTTGHSEIVKPQSEVKEVSYGEILDKYFVKTFVIARNGYEWQTVQNSYSTVKLMSEPKVFAPYETYIKGEQSPTVLFKDLNSIEVKTKAITFLPSSSDSQTVVQVQFTRDIKNREGKTALGYRKTIWEATLTFDYLADINTEDERLLNPLGFNVTSYREDEVTE
ncbi:conjugal transfer protein TraG [Vibrio cyclitrophicus 1F175]|uniref:virB8 family protein n=1 Tax=Vibrio TaxID=662 RepID=UPI0002DC132F|nr:type IV secretion system protein [Vibrio cyclitrophicus]OEF63571.1 conjugal transfer protein TraG [Vibrio cyclitrophicus 1F175]